jgi:hypothetical protein
VRQLIELMHNVSGPHSSSPYEFVIACWSLGVIGLLSAFSVPSSND